MQSSIIIILVCYVELYFQQEVRQHLTSCVLRRKLYVPMAVLSCNRWYFTFDGAECTKPASY